MTLRILIDDARSRPSQAFLFERPQEIIRADAPAEVPAALDQMQEAIDGGKYVAGFMAYELGYALEPRLGGLIPAQRQVPLLMFGVFGVPEDLKGAGVDGYLVRRRGDAYTLGEPALTLGKEDYETRFEAVKRYISAGDIYQLNLTLKAKFAFSGSPWSLYADLRRKQPVSYGAVIEADDFTVVSASPELFIDIDGDRISTRPMKGTAARALTHEDDQKTERWLSSDLKSRAENLMIVDLMRNDVGRVARTGSVTVSDLFTVETYETLHQMTSGVEARLKHGTDVEKLARALFPPGSVTGAPKVRAMEIIRELECEPRGVYTGGIGFMAPDGRANFNVAIRTLTLFADGAGEVGIGSGVVHDSESGAEYDECILKMRFLTEPARDFQLIETMLFDAKDGGYALLDRHLRRLENSARYFLFPFDRAEIAKSLEQRAANLRDAPYRVRLLLFRDGHHEISETNTAGTEQARMSYTVSDHRVRSSDVFLFHKTTERRLYDEEWTRMRDALGSDEVVFLNERGEVCEGSRTNIFVKRGDEILTPALSCGLLPGTLREDLLASGRAKEAVLTLADLARAEAVFLGNSVRGLVPAELLQLEDVRSAAS